MGKPMALFRGPDRRPRRCELKNGEMKYAYYDLYPQQFESLVVAICHFILGPRVVRGL